METFFQKSLLDIIRGIRLNSGSRETIYLSKVLEESLKELKSSDIDVKTNALNKLVFLQMFLGTDISNAAFRCLEVMSSHRFAQKNIGYLSACLCFDDSRRSTSEVLLLTTNLLRKDLASTVPQEVALALNFISRASNLELSNDIFPDIVHLLSSSRNVNQRRTTLTLVRIIQQCPDSLPSIFRRLVDCLTDDSPAIVSAVVSVICELSTKNPSTFLSLSPELCRLLSSSSSPYTQIKILKLFNLFFPLESRLKRKIFAPVYDLIKNSSSKSLLIECIKIIFKYFSDNSDAQSLCINHLNNFLKDNDPNLRLLSLRALELLTPFNLSTEIQLKNSILSCLDDADVTTRSIVLKLITSMVSEDNIIPTVSVLMKQMQSADVCFRNEIIQTILSMCCHNYYERVVDFEWLIQTLVSLARVRKSNQGLEIARQLIDLGMRIPSMRCYLVYSVRRLLMDIGMLTVDLTHFPTAYHVISSGAWLSGEYACHVSNHLEIIESLLQPSVRSLPSFVQSLCLHAVLKLLLSLCIKSMDSVLIQSEDSNLSVLTANGLKEGNSLESSLDKDLKKVNDGKNESSSMAILPPHIINSVIQFVESDDVEVQNCAYSILTVVDMLINDEEKMKKDIIIALGSIFENELLPVAENAQSKVALPSEASLSFENERLSSSDKAKQSKVTLPSAKVTLHVETSLNSMRSLIYRYSESNRSVNAVESSNLYYDKGNSHRDDKEKVEEEDDDEFDLDDMFEYKESLFTKTSKSDKVKESQRNSQPPSHPRQQHSIFYLSSNDKAVNDRVNVRENGDDDDDDDLSNINDLKMSLSLSNVISKQNEKKKSKPLIIKNELDVPPNDIESIKKLKKSIKKTSKVSKSSKSSSNNDNQTIQIVNKEAKKKKKDLHSSKVTDSQLILI